MKRLPASSEESRFTGALRHYHRSGSPSQRTWEEWVDGKITPSGERSNKWMKVAVILLSLLGLGGIIVGLIVELW